MNFTTAKSYCIVFLMLIISIGARAASTQATWSSPDDWDAYNMSISLPAQGYTISADKSSAINEPVVNATYGDLRVYANGVLSIYSISQAPIKKVTFRLSAQGKRRLPELSANSGTFTYDTNNGIVYWEGSEPHISITVGSKATLGTDGETKAGQFCIESPIIIEDGDGSGETENPKPSSTISIGEAQKLTIGSTCKVRGTICCTGISGFLTGDGTGYIYYYNPSANGNYYKEGDIISISGELGNYGGFNQFVEGAVITSEGSGTPPVATPIVLKGADVDKWMSAPEIKYIEVQGTFNMTGAYYNLAIPGTSVVGSLGYSSQHLLNSLEEGETYTVRGYAFMSTGGSRYISIMATSIIKGTASGSTSGPLEPEVPIGAVCLNFTENYSDLAQDALIGSYTRNGIRLSFAPQCKVGKDENGYTALQIAEGTEITVETATGNTFCNAIFGLSSESELTSGTGETITQLLSLAKVDASSAIFTATKPSTLFYTIVDYAGAETSDDNTQKFRLTVDIPDNLYDSRLKNFFLCIANKGTGSKQTFAVSHGAKYTIGEADDKSEFEIYFCDASGTKVSEPTTAIISGCHQSVSLESSHLPQFCSLYLAVQDSNGTDLTHETNIKWLRADNGDIAGESNAFTAAIQNYEYKAEVSLTENIKRIYRAPDAIAVRADEKTKKLTATIDKIPEICLKGCITDKNSGLPIANVNISVTQVFGASDKTTSSVKTDSDGLASVAGAAADTELSIAKEDYLSAVYSFTEQEILAAIASAGNTIDLGKLYLEPVSGTALNLEIAYIDNEGNRTEPYPQLEDIELTLLAGEKIIKTSYTYPTLVIVGNVEATESLILSATSKSGSFHTVSTPCTLNDSVVGITIKQKGALGIDCHGDGFIIAYNKNGEAVAHSAPKTGTTVFDGLDDGEYTIVGLHTDDAGKWASLTLLSEAGLKQGDDYVSVTAECRSGSVVPVVLGEIPASDAAITIYTGDAASVALNKNVSTIGNNVTLTAFVDFANEYKNQIGSTELSIVLPDGIRFIANSVLANNKASAYSYDAATSTLSVPVSTTGCKVRLCISAEKAGDFTVPAAVRFVLNNASIVSPIGSVALKGQNLSLEAPSVIAGESVNVSGLCAPESEVRIYDGDILIGSTTANSSGAWNYTASLHEPFNNTIHTLSAKIRRSDGSILDSESKDVKIDCYSVIPLKVTMINTDHSGNSPREQVSVFNLETKTAEGNTYYRYWPAYPTFSFIIDLSNNSREAVEDLSLLVYTSRQTWRALQGIYNEELGKWTASDNFTSSELPLGVHVNVLASTPTVVDRRLPESIDKDVDIIMADFNSARANESIPEDDYISDPENSAYYASLSDEELEELTSDSAVEATLAGIERVLQDADVWFTMSLQDVPDLAAKCGIRYQQYKERNEEAILADGYSKIDFTDEKPVYTRTLFNVVDVIDVAQRLHWQFDLTESAETASAQMTPAKISGDEISQKVQEAILKINGAIQSIQSHYTDLEKKFSGLEDILNDEIEKVIRESQAIRELRGRRYNDIEALNQELQNGVDAIREAQINAEIAKKKKQIDTLSKNFDRLKKKIADGKNAIKDLKLFKGWFKKALPLMKLISLCNDAISALKVMFAVYNSLPEECPCDKTRFDWLRAEAKSFCASEITYIVTRVTIDLVNSLSSVGATLVSGGTALPLVAAKEIIKKIVIDIAADFVHSKVVDTWSGSIKRRAAELKKGCPPPCDDNNDDIPEPEPCDCLPFCTCYKLFCTCRACIPPLPFPLFTPIQDPSGFVFEGIESNRIPGVTATVYHKQTTENEYGDPLEETMQWNAAKYGQENPLLTDDNGYYRWDVPDGLWQVKFEKEGYQTATTEWLPVPPPQLDVNVAMTHLVAPEVSTVSATRNSVNIIFDKPMLCSSIDSRTLFVKDKGAIVSGEITFADNSVKDDTELASTVIFTPAVPFAASEVEILISQNTKAYSGITMTDDYRHTVPVTAEISGIELIGTPEFKVGDETTATFKLLPEGYGAGMSVSAEVATPSLLETANSVATADASGRVTFHFKGKMAGTAIVTVRVDNTKAAYSMTAEVTPEIKRRTARPQSSVPTNTAVEKGTQIFLSCTTPGAYILYTIDGSDPSEVSESVIHYDTTPIFITDDVTIKAIAVAPDMEDSEISTFRYIVNRTSGVTAPTSQNGYLHLTPNPVTDILNVSTEHPFGCITVYSLTGAEMAKWTSKENTCEAAIDLRHLAGGMYIIKVQTVQGAIEDRLIKR